MRTHLNHPLPSLHRLTGYLREINRAYSHPIAGPEHVYLAFQDPDFPNVGGWVLASDPHDMPHASHSELVPGDYGELTAVEVRPGVWRTQNESKFDAVGAARRLLAASRDWLAAERDRVRAAEASRLETGDW